MKADGTIWIDTKIDDSGMEDGFNRIRDGADDVAVSFRNAGKTIEKSFSSINFNKTIENLKSQIRSLEAEFASVSREFEDAVKMDDDKAAERLGAKRSRIYDRIARARDKLAVEVAAAAEKEAAAEEKASRRILAAEEKESAKRKQLSDELVKSGNSASYFGSRLRGIVSSALVFNVISSGLRKVTSYFGSALMANNQFANAVYRLQGSLMVAFQPIYEAVLPALIQLIEWLNVAVQAVARFFSVLAGKSYSQMQSNAQSLGTTMGTIGSSSSNSGESVEEMGDSIQEAGNQAKKAEKYLAGFDEINRMLREDTDDLSDSLGNLDDIGTGNTGVGDLGLDSIKGPIFEDVELPQEWETAIDKLAMRFNDIFFEWDNLNPEIITEKLLTALTTVAGGLIGFALGGPGGAIIGMIVGAGLGVVLSSIIFDGDGKFSAQEFLQTLIIALGIIGGGIIGFAAGGLGGAAIGVTIGAGLSMLLVSWIFDGDGSLSESELTNTLILVLGAACALIGFTALGGVGGALIGAAFGVSLSMILKSAAFNNDGKISEGEMITTLVAALAIIGAGIVLFSGGGVLGAVIGATVGISMGLTLTSAVFNNDGNLDSQELLQSLVSVLMTIFGGLIGFWIGGHFGPVGAVAGAAIGATVGLALSFSLMNVEFGEVEKEYDNLKKKVETWSDQTTQATEERYIEPTSTGFKNLQRQITTDIEQSKNSILQNMDMAATGTDMRFFEPMARWSAKLADNMTNHNKQASEKTSTSWKATATNIERDFILPTDKSVQNLGTNIVGKFQMIKTRIQSTFQSLHMWFNDHVVDPIWDLFDRMFDQFIDGLNNISRELANLLNSFSRVRSSTSSSRSSSYSANAASVMYAPTPEIPLLARGAVIPSNAPFLAVLGDQKHGTNVEAPLETIQEAVALVMDDVVQSNLAGFEAVVTVLQEILETLLGIEIGDQVIAEAVQRYQSKMAVVRGG